jgi:hypothetical protein
VPLFGIWWFITKRFGGVNSLHLFAPNHSQIPIFSNEDEDEEEEEEDDDDDEEGEAGERLRLQSHPYLQQQNQPRRLANASATDGEVYSYRELARDEIELDEQEPLSYGE